MKIMVLHLSDMHSRPKNWPNNLGKEICRTVEDVAADCDFAVAVVSGDIAASGTHDEYSLVGSLFSDMISAFRGRPIAKDLSFVTVPGNHDCNLTRANPDRSALIEKIKSIPPEEISISTINQCAAVQSDYFGFAAQLDNDWGQQRLVFLKTIKFADYQLTFYCFNTAWMYVREQPRANLLFPIACASRIIVPVNSNLNISVLHHPLEWFAPDNRRLFKEYLTRNSDLVLTGHEHQIGKRLEDNLEGKITLYIEGGRLHDLDDRGDCGFISLIIDTSTSTHRIMQYQWNGGNFKLTKDNQWAPNYGKKLGRISMNAFIISESFQIFLNSLEAPIFHRNKTEPLKLDDVYIFPTLRDLDVTEREDETLREYFDSSEFVSHASDTKKTLILGEAKSGKTALCKTLFRKYHSSGYVPVYINAKHIQHSSLESFDKLIASCLMKEYDLKDTDDYANLDNYKHVLFIDDIEKIPLPTEDLASLLDKVNAKYANVFIFANTVFELQDLLVRSPLLYLALKDYRKFAILQFGFELRLQLIQKWNRIDVERPSEEELLRKDDEYQQTMNVLMRNGGIIPAYPIFLITILLAIQSDATQNLEQSSYSHYFQFIISRALVTLHLSNSELDLYYSFLTDLAQKLFLAQARVISNQEIAEFHGKFVRFYRVSPYSGMVYHLEKLMANLCAADLIEEDRGSYSFKQGFAYYFFVGKYLSENRSSKQVKAEILNLIKGLQYDEYANILMFVVHHTKEDYILQAMVNHAKSIFSQYAPLKFDNDTTYISDLIEEIPVAVLERIDVNKYRASKMKEKDRTQQPQYKTPALRDKEIPPKSEGNSDALGFITDLIIATNLIDLMGQILLNYRSIPGDRQEEIAEEVYLLGLRCLFGLFTLLSTQRDAIIERIAHRIIESAITDEKAAEKQAKRILFTIYHIVAYALIKVVSNSLGSETLSAVVVDIPSKYPYLSVELIDLSAKLNQNRSFPQGELTGFLRKISIPRNPAPSSFTQDRAKAKPQIQRGKLLPFMLLRQMMEEYLYKFPTNWQDRQRICSMVGIEVPVQLAIEQTSEERKEKKQE